MYIKKMVFAAACLGMLLFGIGLITLGSVAPDLRVKYNLTEAEAGILFSILPIGILSGSLLFGPISDKYGYKLLMVLSAIGMAAGFEGIAFAPTTLILKVFIFIFGLAGGIINGATNAAVADISTESKGANLSLLGVFFGIGALGMPFVLGIMKDTFTYEQIVASVGIISLAVAAFYSFIKFPASKAEQGFPLAKSTSLFTDSTILFIAFFLFCQSSAEAIINNWTTTYLITNKGIDTSSALYALTLYVVGMTIMRLLLGSVLRHVSSLKLLLLSIGLFLTGIILLQFSNSFIMAVTGLVLIGAGLAGGFPIMLGIAGNKYAAQSGTAFSFILFVALTGNILVNYLMGIIANSFGTHHLTTVALSEIALMLLLIGLIFRRPKIKHNTYVSNTMVE